MLRRWLLRIVDGGLATRLDDLEDRVALLELTRCVCANRTSQAQLVPNRKAAGPEELERERE
jgi:hypothetical protein